MYDHSSMRKHLLTCLENVSISRIPTLCDRSSGGVKREQEIELFCVCRLPEEKGVLMAECSQCEMWYHRHCVDIPQECLDSEDVPWLCPTCSQL